MPTPKVGGRLREGSGEIDGRLTRRGSREGGSRIDFAGRGYPSGAGARVNCSTRSARARARDLQAIAADRWMLASLVQEFEREGVELPLVEHGQGYKDHAAERRRL